MTSRRVGFTLTEIVLMIAVAVASLSLVVLHRSRVTICTMHDSARTQIGLLNDAVTLCRDELRSLPPDLIALMGPPADLISPSQWNGPYLEKDALPVDPWNQPYRYQTMSKDRFRIWSIGPDGVSGTRDD